MLSSKGSITNPRDKLCPTKIVPWSDFLEQQEEVLSVLYENFPTENRVFETRSFLAGLGERISRRPIADEKTLEYFLHNSVEDPVRVIIEQLKGSEKVKSLFNIGDGIIFENHPHAISDIAEEVAERDNRSILPRTPEQQTIDHRRDLNQLRFDQICIYRSDSTHSMQRRPIYIAEYKPPHKLTAPFLGVGLRPMDIYKEVVNRKTIPTSVDPEARFQYQAERLTASAITQTYHYMVQSGLEYGLLTTGESFVFLKIDWDKPEILYYHLAEPSSEVSAHPNHFYLWSAVSQLLAFTLIALGAPGEQQVHGQQERDGVIRSLKRWAVDFETTLKSIPERERLAMVSGGSSYHEPVTHSAFQRTPYLLRKRKRVSSPDQPGDDLIRGPPEPSDDESAPEPPVTPTPTRRSGPRRQSERLRTQQMGGNNEEQERQYCTQKCLLGLVRKGPLDSQCPNVRSHQNNDSTRINHPVAFDEWLQLLRKQLEWSLDEGITPLPEGGARSVLFKVTLLTYGYTFVSKGTVQAFIPDLEHEGTVYNRLQSIQGVHVPVFLGAINLQSMNKTYYYTHRVYVVHMTFLSWAGCCIETAGELGDKETMAIQSLQMIHQQGVIHRDIRMANMLFNRERNGVMVIDFERAVLLKPPRRPLAQAIPNKRAQRGLNVLGAQKVSSNLNTHRRPDHRFAEDISMAKLAFF